MKILLISLSVSCLLHLAVSMKTYAQTPADVFKLIDYQQYDTALKSIKLMNNGSGSHNNFYFGYLSLKKGDIASAEKEFAAGLKANPKEGIYLAGLGYVALAHGHVEQAESYFDQALQVSKRKDPDVLYIIGEAYKEHNRSLTRALEFTEQALEMDPDNVRHHLLKGDVYLAMNNAGKAVSAYEDAAATNPLHGVPFHKIGVLYWKSKNTLRAEEAFNKSMASDFEYFPVLKDQAELAFAKKDLIAAESFYERYIQKVENPSYAVKGRYGYFCYLNKSYSKAIEVFESILGEEEKNPLIAKYLAYSLAEQKKTDDALVAFNEYFTLTDEQNRDWKDYEIYGKLLLEAGNHNEAIANFEKAFTRNKTSEELTQFVAETAFRLKQYSTSIIYYNHLITLRKVPHAQDHYILGRSYYYHENFTKADSIFNILTTLQPQSHIGYLWHARSLANLDPETEEGLAKGAYEKVIELAPVTEAKYKDDLKEAHSYLGYYFYLKGEYYDSTIHWKKVQTLDPLDEKAKEALKALVN